MKTKTIRQQVTFNAEPAMIYDLLMNAARHSAFTQSEVIMDYQEDGQFSTYDGYCNGYNITLVPGEKIVQAWHFAEEGWPEDHFSICTFNLEKTPKGTRLHFTQERIPEHKYEALKQGWKDHYWDLIKIYLSENS